MRWRRHAHTYAAVLLDLMMPRMNAWEVPDELAREDIGRLVCVIVVSAALPKRGLPPEQRSHVYAVIAKPFDLNELLTTVRGCVDGERHH